MAYSKQTWDTTSYVNPTRMNHIEDGIEEADSKTADDIEYSTGVSVKDKIDEKAEAENYSNLAITNSRGGAETNKANLKACGNIGFCRFSFKCQNSSSEDLTVALPSGWYFCYGAYSMRDTTNGQLVTVWAQSNVLSTYLHTGTTTVGNSYTITVPCFKA